MKINEDILVIKKSKSFEYMQYKRLLDLGINHAYILKSDNFAAVLLTKSLIFNNLSQIIFLEMSLGKPIYIKFLIS